MVHISLNLPRQSTYRFPADRRGSILILSIWSLMLLATFAVVLSYGVRQKLTLVTRLDNRDKLRFIADAGVKKAIVELEILMETVDKGQRDKWSSAMSAVKQRRVGDGLVRYAIIDEARKININTAKRDVMERLFNIVLGFDEVEAQELAASIVDWRDEDSMLSIPLGSAEDRDYKGLLYPYESKDAEFEVLDEVLLVNGVTADVYKKLKDYITIYGSGKININTAPKEIFLTLGLSEDLADLVSMYRAGEDGIIDTEDDNIFDNHSSIVSSLSRFYHLSDSQVAQLSQIVNKYLTVTSDNFMIKSTATFPRKKGAAEVNCAVDRSGTILYWHEQ